MEQHQPLPLFRKLFSAIQKLLEHPELHTGDSQELKRIFFHKLSDILQLSFDIHISEDTLTECSKRHENDADEVALTQCIVDAIENDDTYILLNFYMYRFIQAYMESMKQEAMYEAIRLLAQEGLSEKELQAAIDQYEQYVRKMHHLTSTSEVEAA